MFNWEIIRDVVMGCAIYNVLFGLVNGFLQWKIKQWESRRNKE